LNYIIITNTPNNTFTNGGGKIKEVELKFNIYLCPFVNFILIVLRIIGMRKKIVSATIIKN